MFRWEEQYKCKGQDYKRDRNQGENDEHLEFNLTKESINFLIDVIIDSKPEMFNVHGLATF
jgi:hypothetical protein